VTHPSSGKTYRPPDYWNSLCESVDDLGIVGDSTLPLAFNQHVYENAAGGCLAA
jgi:hypothetical protein